MTDKQYWEIMDQTNKIAQQVYAIRNILVTGKHEQLSTEVNKLRDMVASLEYTITIN